MYNKQDKHSANRSCEKFEQVSEVLILKEPNFPGRKEQLVIYITLKRYNDTNINLLLIKLKWYNINELSKIGHVTA